MPLWYLAFFATLALGLRTHSPLEIHNNEFTLIMRSGELIYRYSFYGGFWLKMAEFLGTPMSQAFTFNISINNPSMALRHEEQYVELHALPGEYLPLFQRTTLSKICCLVSPNPLQEFSCQSSSFDPPELFTKLVQSNATVPSKLYNFTYRTVLKDNLEVDYAGPYYLVLTSCSEKQYLQVFPSVKGVSKYGHLSAEEFPLLAAFLFFGVIYVMISFWCLLVVYVNKSFIGTLHYLFLVTVLLNACYFFVAYSIKQRENRGVPIERLVYVLPIANAAMCAMNALVALLLSVGYGLTDRYTDQYKKIIGVCIIYFLTLTLPISFDTTKVRAADDKYDIFVLLFTVGIAATISFL